MNSKDSTSDQSRISIRLRARKAHIAFKVLPQLEKDFANCLFELSTGTIPKGTEILVHTMLREHVSMLRMELSTAFRALSDIRKWMESAKITDSDYENYVQTYYRGYPELENINAALRNCGGASNYFKRMSKTLLSKHDSYGKCIARINETDPKDPIALGKLAVELFDIAPGSLGVPDTQYSIICLGGPLAWAISAGLVVIIIVAKDDSGRDEPPTEPDPEDDDGGICVPGDGLDGFNVQCQ